MVSGQGDIPETVVVTGGADGIGRVVSARLRRAGYQVHVCDNRPAAIADMARLHPDIGGSVADVSQAEDVTRLFAEARAAMGSVGVLVNNVGIGGPRASVDTIPLADWEFVFRVNVTGSLMCMQAAIPEMKARRAGSIINLSTASTRTRLPDRSAYIASKFALEGLTLNAARELGPFNVRCNAILPGIINNARMDQIIAERAAAEARAAEDIDAEYMRGVSMRQRTQPEDIAEAVLFLASPAAARVTGERMSVSGNLEWEQ